MIFSSFFTVKKKMVLTNSCTYFRRSFFHSGWLKIPLYELRVLCMSEDSYLGRCCLDFIMDPSNFKKVNPEYEPQYRRLICTIFDRERSNFDHLDCAMKVEVQIPEDLSPFQINRALEEVLGYQVCTFLIENVFPSPNHFLIDFFGKKRKVTNRLPFTFLPHRPRNIPSSSGGSQSSVSRNKDIFSICSFFLMLKYFPSYFFRCW